MEAKKRRAVVDHRWKSKQSVMRFDQNDFMNVINRAEDKFGEFASRERCRMLLAYEPVGNGHEFWEKVRRAEPLVCVLLCALASDVR